MEFGKVEHIFLPTYRYEQQLYDLYASPQSITNSRNKEYVLAEILSSLAVKLGAKAVLIDLRAGISEYSAPLLLDPIKTEYESLKPIFEKLEELPPEKKHLPISQEENLLSAQEEKLMKQAGYLTREGDNLYLPEIIRHALGFRYERGARPRVLALILSK